MKNRILFLLIITISFFAPATTHAGFLMKKHAVVRTTAAATTTSSATGADARNAQVAEMLSTLQETRSPSGTFVRMLYRGQVSTIAFIFAILGFFLPIFAIGAILFGFLGFSNRNFSKKGYGIAAFILGIIAVSILAFGGLAPLPVF
ncbi:hypothetical protein GCM10023093_23200 [Nemorincola caseinilytica]|uniref:Uncharacterized protein n=1 Tax=Nemorincola caseinilytica TaxID=2054315 RepID=A0ABP8NKY7_9BACT